MFYRNKSIFRVGTVIISIWIAVFGVYCRMVSASAADYTHFLSNGLVSFSPDRTAFTIGYKDKTAQRYDYGSLRYKVMIFGNIGLPQLENGQHYYEGLVVGETKVGYWLMNHIEGRCVHSENANYRISSLDKMGANNRNCGGSYNAGWISYCACCGRMIAEVLVYMTEDMARRTAYLPSGNEFSNYFYLCPYDNSLENYRSTNHICTQVSANRYKVVYNANDNRASGKMGAEWFMYDNSDIYEGNEISVNMVLTSCLYSLRGKRFVGWSNQPKGEALIADGEQWINVQEILNVAEKDNEDSIILYAIWENCDEENETEENIIDEDTKKENEKLVLQTEIHRKLIETDSRVEFIRGESGVLNIEVIGGADYVVVEFPEEMDSYNMEYDYSECHENVKKESIEFCIPIYGIADEKDNLIVTVTAYKEDIIVSSYPVMMLIGGQSVLDELRTSLR